MASPLKKDIVAALMDRHGRTFAEEVGIGRVKDTPSSLFRLLVMSILFSARIGHRIAVDAAAALTDAGWTTPDRMADAGWERRTKVLNESGYASYDESTSRMLGDTCDLLLDRYTGDLRRLRDAAERDPDEERRLLKEFKGLGDTGVDIFFREVQTAWDEVHPFADRRALRTADDLGLASDARDLARLADGDGDRESFARLTAALVRTGLEDDADEVRRAARAA